MKKKQYIQPFTECYTIEAAYVICAGTPGGKAFGEPSHPAPPRINVDSLY